MALRTSRAALTHAVLTAIHPAIAHPAPFPFPVQLPAELHLLIRTHLRVHIARALLAALHAALAAALAALCDDCKSYYAHVFGPHVADWPVIQAGRGCRCTSLGLPSARPSWKTASADASCSEQDLPQRPPVGDREPPAYFLAHIQKTLATYASMDPSFPYADQPIASGTDLDALLSRVLSTLGWNAIPPVSHRNWEFDNSVEVVPLQPVVVPPVTLDGLQLHLDLAIHDEILATSSLHPNKVTYFPPLPPPATTAACYSLSPLSTSIVSALVLLAVASPLAVVYSLRIS